MDLPEMPTQERVREQRDTDAAYVLDQLKLCTTEETWASVATGTKYAYRASVHPEAPDRWEVVAKTTNGKKFAIWYWSGDGEFGYEVIEKEHFDAHEVGRRLRKIVHGTAAAIIVMLGSLVLVPSCTSTGREVASTPKPTSPELTRKSFLDSPSDFSAFDPSKDPLPQHFFINSHTFHDRIDDQLILPGGLMRPIALEHAPLLRPKQPYESEEKKP